MVPSPSWLRSVSVSRLELLHIMFFSAILLAALAVAKPSPRFPHDPRPYSSHARRTVANFTESGLVVDLGYEIYRGTRNESANLNNFRGIRFGQDTSAYRWQPPRAPLTNRSAIIDASDYSDTCPQAPDASSAYVPTDNSGNSEDCLFLNVTDPKRLS